MVYMGVLFVTIITSIVGGGALLTFIQFLINRHDNKNDKYKEIADEIKLIRADIESLKADMAEDRATNARIRILTFADEVLHKQKHSKESFDQIHEDMDRYNKYCKEHENYENSKAVAAMATINKAYQHYEDNFLDYTPE